MADLLTRLRDAGTDYTIAWGSGELYDEAADEIERLLHPASKLPSDESLFEIGMDYAYTEATDPAASDDWSSEDVARAFEAGAKWAIRQHAKGVQPTGGNDGNG